MTFRTRVLALTMTLTLLACSSGDDEGSSFVPGADGGASSGGGVPPASGGGAMVGGGGGATVGEGATSSGGAFGGGAPSGGIGAGGVDAGGTGGGDAGGTDAGGAGGASAGGTGGAVATCTPGSGTEPVGAGAVLDRATCLTWTAEPFLTAAKTPVAMKACEALTQDGFDDWRLPTTEELASHPTLAVGSNAYVAGPSYAPTSAVDDATGCAANGHSCNLAQYSTGNLSCAWQGVGFQGPYYCVRGDAAAGSLDTGYAATQCGSCATGVTSFREADCRPYID